MSSPTALSQVTPGLDALLHRAAYAPIENTGWIRVTGGDRVRWLNGMVTNNIAELKPGEGNYNFFLNAQGRIQGDCTAWMLEDSILLETAADRVAALMAMLDHFIIMDDVELMTPEEMAGILLCGPNALDLLHTLHFAAEMEPLQFEQTQWQAEQLTLIHAYSSLVPCYELWSTPAAIAKLIDELGALDRLSQEELANLRIFSGTPLYGTDIREKDLPQETNQTRALHFSKGCYLGQEIVERIRSRGQVHRTFAGFLLSPHDLSSSGEAGGPAFALPTPLTDEQGKAIGELTSVTRIGAQIFALGTVRREALERPGGQIQYAGGTATPSALPFPLSTLQQTP